MSIKVNTGSPDYEEIWKPIWQRCRDFVSGQDAVMRGGKTYLPALDGQSTTAYTKYLESGYLYNASGRTLEGLAGMIMRKDPDINVPDSLLPLFEDIDQEGTSLWAFAEDLVKEELTTSRAGLLVDYPERPGDERLTEKQAEELKLRPYATVYRAEDILRPRYKRIGNAVKLVHLRLRETEEIVDPADEFDTLLVQRVRVLELTEEAEGHEGQWVFQVRVFESKEEEAWHEVEDKRRVPKIAGEPINEIPFVWLGDAKFREPVILDLVNANLQHYVQTADHRAGLKWTTRPQPWVTGETENNAVNVDSLGAGKMWFFPSPEARVGMLEYSGEGLTAMENTLAELKEEMATLGARMIAPEKRQAETEEVHVIKRQGENSALATVSTHGSRALTQMVQWFARWLGLDIAPKDISIRLNSDFVPSSMSTTEIKDLWTVYVGGGMTREDYIWNLNQGERLDPSISDSERKTQLETQEPPGLPNV